MKDSVKANLIVFLIIAVIAFGVSSAFANLTVTEDTTSYKMIPIKNDSFEPKYIDEVPTIIPKVVVNYTNTSSNHTYNGSDIPDTNNTLNDWSFNRYGDW
ncbi:hypothetical protein TL18_06210 [Methanobrevibacter sp. YE315]|uniref:hypothetical protein n=1 Tax=Methanobrevibacter sp. YE315 TaxID=1609968 RepID=UPI000764F1B1|nr:hypothetical protein [Methanobrevibacter sp. YE315]AMD17648.1 hypothetical protein TL18_06210 [Methanobrevibacter sp. YE315]